MSARPLRIWKITFWIYVALVASISASAYLRLLPRDSGLLALPHADHAIHFLLLGGASFLSHRALGGRWVTSRRARAPLGPLIVGALSLTDECLQAFVPWRTFDLIDMVSNLSGVVFFGVLAEAIIRKAIRDASAPTSAAPRSAPPAPQSPTTPAP